MEIIKTTKNKFDKIIIDKIVDYLNLGKIIALPTDTIYGLSCDATDKKAIRKIIKLKKRNSSKGMIILVDSIKMAKVYCYINKEQEKLLYKLWTSARPTTVILKKKCILPSILIGNNNSLTIRLPKEKNIVKIVGAIGKPIVSTSLNIAGESPMASSQKIFKYFQTKDIDLIIDKGKTKNKKPSRIIDVKDIKKIKIIRK